jgi:hypothetical protein
MPVPDSRKPQALVHIGPMKTGSSSIQLWLWQQREALGKAGVHLLRCLERANHSDFVKALLAEGREATAASRGLLEAVRAELAAPPANTATLVLSSELFGEGMRRPEIITRLKAFLDPFVGGYRILTYLRRQDRRSVSLAAQVVRRGERRDPLATHYNYARVLTAWQDVFGRAAIVPRIYERQSLVDGDVVADFIDAAGIPTSIPRPARRIEANTALTPAAAELLTRLNLVLDGLGLDREARLTHAAYRRVSQLLARNHSGAAPLPARADAIRFYRQFRYSNELVRAQYFPERKTLFHEDFSEYPDVAASEPTADEMLDVAIALLAGLTSEER